MYKNNISAKSDIKKIIKIKHCLPPFHYEPIFMSVFACKNKYLTEQVESTSLVALFC